jgi:uncharacterized protein (TIGR02453 family)
VDSVFRGFPPEAIAFYEGLEADNSKTYWEAHRDTYEECVRDPMEELILELHPEFGAGKVFRPYRDMRFSKEKTPYKTACGALMRPDGAQLAGHYVEVSARGVTIGAGAWHFMPDAMAKVRRAIDDEGKGQALARIADELSVKGMPLHEPELKTAPRGFPRDHPRIELLRRKRFAALTLLPRGRELQSRKALERITERLRAGRPLNEWLERAAA